MNLFDRGARRADAGVVDFSTQNQVGVVEQARALVRDGRFREASLLVCRAYRLDPASLLTITERDLDKARNWLDSRVANAKRGYSHTTEDLTPALAQLFLSARVNESNRPLNPNKIEAMMRDIIRRAWQLNGETIIFSEGGQLNDGQHRSISVLVTGVSIRTDFRFNVTRQSRETVDIGSKRTPGDRLSMKGVPSGNQKQSIVGLLYPVIHGRQPTDTERHEWYFENAATIDLAHGLGYGVHIGNVSRAALAAAAGHLLMNGARRERVIEFFKLLKTGVGLKARSPVYTIREAFTKKGFSLDKASLMRSVTAHYNRWARDSKASTLIAPSEFEPVETR